MHVGQTVTYLGKELKVRRKSGGSFEVQKVVCDYLDDNGVIRQIEFYGREIELLKERS